MVLVPAHDEVMPALTDLEGLINQWSQGLGKNIAGAWAGRGHATGNGHATGTKATQPALTANGFTSGQTPRVHEREGPRAQVWVEWGGVAVFWSRVESVLLMIAAWRRNPDLHWQASDNISGWGGSL